MKIVALFAFSIAAAATAAPARPLSDAQVRERIIQQSIADFPGACPCPYSVLRNGRTCGSRSHYNRPGGYTPICYPRDINDAAVREWRAGRRR